MEEFKIFDELNKCKGYEYALMTTFNFEIEFFERFILNTLYDHNIKNISLFVDSKELNKALNNINNSSIGKKYMVNPVEINGSFHPKVILLLGKNKAKLFVASANLTSNGYMLNNEIFNIFEYNEQHPEGLKIINDAIKFFINLNEMSYKKDEPLFEEIKRLIYYGKEAVNDETYLINNLSNSILNQVNEIVTDAKSIDIAVPYYDNYLEALKSIHEKYPSAKINLYIQNEKSKFPIEYKDSELINKIITFNGFNDRKSTAFYHGKVIRFKTEENSYILYGSANCTKSALIKSQKENGNVECDILEKGTLNEFDYFFDNFKLEEEKELSCELLQVLDDNDKQNNFYYKYGELKSDLKMYLGFINKKDNVKITHDSQELMYNYENNLLVVSMPLEDTFYIDDIFKIQIYYENITEEINCWYINYETLELNRNKESKEALYKFDFDSDDDKYIEDRRAILKELSLSVSDIQKELEITNKIEQVNKDVEEEDIDENGDGIIDYVIPSVEEIEKYNKYQFTRKIRNSYIQRYFDDFKLKLESKETNNVNYTQNKTNRERQKRESTTNERNFKRFVKNRINEMQNDKFVRLINFDHYLSSILVFVDIFDKYTIKQPVQDLFDDNYVIKTKINLLNKLLSKEKIDDEIINESTIMLTIRSIIENNYLNNIQDIKDNKVELNNRNLLLKLDKLFNIRNSYQKYVFVAVDNINEYKEELLNYEITLKYIDDLFGYKSKEQLLNIIKKEYGQSTVIETSNTFVNIKTKIDNISKYLKLNEPLVNEIIKHYKNSGNKLEKITVEIMNTKDEYPVNADPAETLVYNIDVLGRNGILIIKRKSGKTDEPRLIKF